MPGAPSSGAPPSGAASTGRAAPRAIRVRAALLVGVVALALVVVPRCVAGRDADALFDGDAAAQDALARHVAAVVLGHRGATFYSTGRSRFDGQSAVAIYQMAILGLGQIALEHPDRRDAYLEAMRSAADRLVDPATLRYAAEVYGRHGVVGMAPGQGHAYLGYINLALGVLRAVDPTTRHAALHDRLSAALAERLEASPTGLIETYPGETWPPDVAFVAGSVGLHARLTGDLRTQAMLEAWAAKFARCAIDPSGYLVQRVTSGGCAPRDAPRGSGTAVAAYALGFASPELSRRLAGALRSEGRIALLGFGGVREYAPGHFGEGDGNAGPIVLGASVGATGFGLGAARTAGDRELFRELYRSTHLLGVPVDVDDGRAFAVGGALGNALLLAMLTARPL